MPKTDPLKKLNYLQRYLVEEFAEDYQEGAMTRRQAIKYIAAVVGSVAAASTFLASCAPVRQLHRRPPRPTRPLFRRRIPAAATACPDGCANGGSTAAAATKAAVATVAPTVAATPTPAQIAATATQAVLTTTATAPTPTPIPVPAGVRVPADDPAIEAGMVTFPGDGLTLVGYQAKPKGNGPFPAIIVAHENRGLTDYIMDVTRRLAKAGYVRAGGRPTVEAGRHRQSDRPGADPRRVRARRRPTSLPATTSAASSTCRGCRSSTETNWAWSASASAAG